jgi:hypothetical protein
MGGRFSVTPSEWLETDRGFADLVFGALDHAIDSVRESGEPLIPLVLLEEAEGRNLHRFVAEGLEESVLRARQAVADCSSAVSAYALAFDGFITLEGTKFDAILVEASQRHRANGIRMAQIYRPKKTFRSFKTIGNPALLGECPSLFSK